MKISLRNFVLAATMVVAAVTFAETPTVTQKWITKHGLSSADYRGATGVGGAVYVTGAKKIKRIDANGVTDWVTTTQGLNKGCVSDDAGNLLVLSNWPTSANNWTKAVLVNGQTKAVKEITLAAPANATGWGGRSDMQGRGIGDFFSAEGGMFFLTNGTQEFPIPIVIANGAFEASPKATTVTGFSAGGNNMSSAVPAVETMAEYRSISNPEDQFCFRTGAVLGEISTVKDGKKATLTQPKNLPTGVTLRSQNGHEVFTLGGEQYQVRMADTQNWSSNFVISDSKGNVIFYSDYSADYKATATGNGCGVYAHKVSDYKVELYQFYATGTTAKGFAAMYEITIPEPEADPEMYVAGEFQGWDPEQAQAMAYDKASDTFSFTFPAGADQSFKLSTVRGDWAAFNGGALSCSSDYTLKNNETVTLSKGESNLVLPGQGEWTITLNNETKELKLSGVQYVTLPDVYLRGGVNGWAVSDSYKFAPVIAEGAEYPEMNVNGEYEMKLYVDRLNGEFKLGDATDYFETFNYGYAGGEIANGATIEVKAGGDNVNMGDVDLMHVNLTLFYNPDASKSSWLKIDGEDYDPEYVVLPDVYLRGDLTGWDVKDAYKLTPPVVLEGHRYPSKNENGEYQYTLTLPRVYGSFKLSGATWDALNYGGDGEAHRFDSESSTLKAWPGSSENFEMGDMILDDVTINFFYNIEKSPSYIQVIGTKLENYTDRAHFAYDLKVEFDNVHGIYHFNFKSTGDAPNAYLVATPVADTRANSIDDDGVISIELGAVAKGDNHRELYDINFGYMKNYTWAIELHNYEIPYSQAVRVATNPETQYTSAKYSSGKNPRGSVIPMVDDQYPSYGYTVVGRNFDYGFDVYNPEGELVATGVHKDHTLMHNPTTQAKNYNVSNGIRGTEHKGHALIASWGDDAHGVVAFDPVNRDEDMYSVFEGDMSSTGLITKDGVKVGSGTPCVAVYGKGDDAVMYTFDEDILSNNIAKYTIGDKRTVATAPFNVGFKGKLTNTNVEICPVKEGIFVTQVRGEGNSRNTGTPGMMFLNNKNIDDAKITAADWYPTDIADENFLTSCNSGVAVNKDETLLAVSTYSKIHIMNLSFADGKPVMTEKETINLPATTSWATMRFDAADNLHYYALGSDADHGYHVYSLANKQPVVKTNAPAESLLLVSTGVENVDVDAAGDAEVIYYNLNGVRMEGTTLAPGVYVKVVGKTATKVVVK